MNTTTRKHFVKSMITLWMFVIGLGTSLSSMAADSTSMRSQRVVPVMLQATPDTTQCEPANTSQHIVVHNSTQPWEGSDWKTSTCPTGYMPYQLQSWISLGLGFGQIEYRTVCCKVKVGYVS